MTTPPAARTTPPLPPAARTTPRTLPPRSRHTDDESLLEHQAGATPYSTWKPGVQLHQSAQHATEGGVQEGAHLCRRRQGRDPEQQGGAAQGAASGSGRGWSRAVSKDQEYRRRGRRVQAGANRGHPAGIKRGAREIGAAPQANRPGRARHTRRFFFLSLDSHLHVNVQVCKHRGCRAPGSRARGRGLQPAAVQCTCRAREARSAAVTPAERAWRGQKRREQGRHSGPQNTRDSPGHPLKTRGPWRARGPPGRPHPRRGTGALGAVRVAGRGLFKGAGRVVFNVRPKTPQNSRPMARRPLLRAGRGACVQGRGEKRPLHCVTPGPRPPPQNSRPMARRRSSRSAAPVKCTAPHPSAAAASTFGRRSSTKIRPGGGTPSDDVTT